MKSWRDAPNLFANAKFNIRENITNDHIQSKFTGIIKVTDGVRVMTELGWSTWIKDCQLIARSVEDMTYEELSSYPGFDYVRHKDNNWVKKVIINRVANENLTFDEFLYLIDNGFYPFGDTTDVIFKTL